jgi:hypothetical protein
MLLAQDNPRTLFLCSERTLAPGANVKSTSELDRRNFLAYFSSIGLGTTLLPGVLWAEIGNGADITTATIASAEEIAGLKFDEAERKMMVDGLKQLQSRIDALHKIPLSNSVSPALVFNPVPPG